MSLAHLFRLLLVLLLLFASFWGLHTAVLLKAAKRTWAEEANRRLTMITQTVEAEVGTQYQKVLLDPAFLRALARQYGSYRITILDRDGRILMDTASQDRIGRQDPLMGMTLLQLGWIWDGAALTTPLYSRPGEAEIRSRLMPIRTPDQKTLGVIRVDLEMLPIDESGPAAVTALLLKVAGGAMILVLAFYASRSLFGAGRLTAGQGSQPGQTAAVINTFHGLVRQLKEKEAELEHLRTLAEERATEVESYNESILRSVTGGVITFNTDHVITTFNQAAERILGVLRTTTIGKTCKEVFGEQSSIYHLLDQALTRHTTITRQELELTRQSEGALESDRIWVGISTSLLQDSQDHVIGTTFVFTDLTEIKSLQEQIELKRRLTVLGEMSAGIAHEFRNYMGTVMGFTKLLSKKLPPTGETGKAEGDNGHEMVDSIMKELTAMNHLIEQLLNFGRHVDLNLQPVALEPLIRKLMDQLNPQTNGSRLPLPQVEISIPPGLPEIRLDEVLIRQALGNLFQNALEAMPDGGELKIRAAVIEHGLPSSTRGQHQWKEVSIVIQDTGSGIPTDKLDKIFMPFFTLKEKGTGMGLALVHKIILLHGGRIEVDSREGGGTTFRILIPMGEMA